MEKAIVSARAKQEYVQAIYHRYRSARRPDKQRILDEFGEVTKHHRKQAIRPLNSPAPGAARRPRHRDTLYSAAVSDVLRNIWEAAGYPWSVRLKALLPLWLPWARRRLRLRPAVEAQVRRISPRQMDRRLAPYRRAMRKRLYGRTKPGTLLKHHIPLKTDRWDVATPGFTEIDLVAHCGSLGDGEFVHSLNLTDIHTTSVEPPRCSARARWPCRRRWRSSGRRCRFGCAASTPTTAPSSSTSTCTTTARPRRCS